MQGIMGRKPVGKRAMTGLERQQRHQAKLRPIRQFERLTAAFLAAEESAQSAFLDWLRTKKFIREPRRPDAGKRPDGCANNRRA
jgi:hypothetical protein